MGVDSALQVLTWLQAVLLGLAGGVVYDLLRGVGRRRTWLTHVCDAVFVALSLLALLRFALGRGAGELRLYALAGIALGLWGYFRVCAPLFRPMWAFWTDTAGAFLTLLARPVIFLWCTGKKVAKKAKKAFYFLPGYATIHMYMWKYTHRNQTSLGGGRHHGKEENREKESQCPDAGRGAAAHRHCGRAAGPRTRRDRRKPR